MTHLFGLYRQTITEEQSLLNHTWLEDCTVHLRVCCAGQFPIQPDATSITHSYTEHVLCWAVPHTTWCNLCYPQLHWACVVLGGSPYNLMQPLLPTVTLSMCCAGRIPIQPHATSVTPSYTEYVLCWADRHITWHSNFCCYSNRNPIVAMACN